MRWLTDWWVRRQLARDARREEYLRALANATPGYQWILVRAGHSDQARSPMLSLSELREWFREYYPNFKVTHIDEDNKILFYE